MELFWEKPVIVFYKEKQKKPERKAFAVVKARRLTIRRDRGSRKLKGTIQYFFPLMGDVDDISSRAGISNRYVLCWMDDREDDFSKAWRRLNGVTFSTTPVFTMGGLGKYGESKRTYNANFEAEQGKLE